MSKLLAAVLAAAVPMLLAASARAADDSALAEMLFREARDLLAANDVKPACEKFAESQRLEPKIGTLLNLATCHEKLGLTATAWAEFTDAERQAARLRHTEREQLAREHVRGLGGRLSRISINVTAPSSPGLEVRVRGRVLGAAAIGSALPVDPGAVTVSASAPGKLRFETTVEVPAGPVTVSIAIPVLLDDETPKTKASPPAEAPVSRPHDGDTTRFLAYSLLGVGAVGVGVGTYFGVVTLAKKSDGDALCQENRCTADGLELHDASHTAATISTIAFGFGLVSAGAGVVVLLTAPSAKVPAVRAARGASVPLRVSFGLGGLSVGGRF